MGGLKTVAESIVVKKALEVTPEIFDNAEIKGVEKRVLIGKNLNAPNFVMRLFRVKPGGNSPRHSHDWEHEVFIVKGEATVVTGEGDVLATAGSYVYVPANVEHQFKNNTEEYLEFICIIPAYAGE